MVSDILQAARILRHNPGFALLAAATLALGIGLNAALFSVVNGVLLAPLPYPEPDRVVALNTVFTNEGRSISRLTGGDFSDLVAQSDLFEAIGGYGGGQVGLQTKDHAEFIGVAFAGEGFLRVLGVAPAAGNWFSATDRTGAVVSEGFARRNFGSAAAALGQTISVENTIYAVVGVAPRALDFPKATDVWLQSERDLSDTNRNAFNYRALARLRPGVTVEAANAQLKVLGSRLAVAFAADNRNKSFEVVALREQLTGNIRPTLFILMSAVALVLLIACANVANLLLARATSRTREIAVRAALGASRWQVIRQLLAENLVLALLGAAAGIALAFWGVDLLVHLAPAGLPRLANIAVSPIVLGFAIAIAILAAFGSGLAPALQLARIDLTASLKQGSGRGSTSGGPWSGLRYGLVVAEIALTVILAIGSGLLFRTFLSLNAVELGFQKEQVLVMYAHAPARGEKEVIEASRMFRNLLPELQVLPGVEHVGAAMGMPAGQYGSDGAYQIQGQPDDWTRLPNALFRLAGPGYFSTMGIPLRRGRDFKVLDDFTAPFVAIISQSLADKSFPGADPIGKQIRCGLDSPRWMTVVGVVADIRSKSPAASPVPELYMPLEQHPFMANELQIAMRVAPGIQPESLSDAARRVVRQRNPAIAVRFTTLDAMLEGAIDSQRFRAFLLTAFAGIAMLLAMAGIYGVMSQAIAQRIPEIGLRMALGAAPGSLLGTILGRAFWLAVMGLAIGLTASAAASRALEGMLFGLKPVDGATYLLVSIAVMAVTGLAAMGPAWRAMRVDPIVALRQE